MTDLGDNGRLWRLTMQHSPVGMALVALDGRFLDVNDALCRFLGHDAEALRSLTFQEVTHPDDLATDLQLRDAILAGERPSYRILKRYRTAQDQVVWGDLSVALLREEDGTPVYFIAQIVDVTEAERERRTLGAIFDAASVGLLLIDREGRYERMNARHAATMSLPFPEGHQGDAGQLGHVYAPDGRRMQREEMPSYRAMQGEEYDDLTYWVGHEPDQRTAFSTSARIVRDAAGEMTHAVLAYQEITALMRALQVKDEFVASVSHELRTPLTAVLGHLELLIDDPDLPLQLRERIAVVERNAARLRLLVSDLLHVASGREGLQISRAETDLAAVVADAVAAARPAAKAADLTMEAELPAHLIGPVDAQRLRQVVDNLLSNAVKYSEAGGRVSVRLCRAGIGVVLTVQDSGLGMSPHDLEQLFTRFFRGGQAQQRHIQGTGLGLNIVRSIVEAHGGEVRVDSEVGVGTTVTVELPVTA